MGDARSQHAELGELLRFAQALLEFYLLASTRLDIGVLLGHGVEHAVQGHCQAFILLRPLGFGPLLPVAGLHPLHDGQQSFQRTLDMAPKAPPDTQHDPGRADDERQQRQLAEKTGVVLDPGIEPVDLQYALHLAGIGYQRLQSGVVMPAVVLAIGRAHLAVLGDLANGFRAEQGLPQAEPVDLAPVGVEDIGAIDAMEGERGIERLFERLGGVAAEGVAQGRADDVGDDLDFPLEASAHVVLERLDGHQAEYQQHEEQRCYDGDEDEIA